ncbi:MAG: DISARM system helicase DrmA, partial [Myxococcota bacterium]
VKVAPGLVLQGLIQPPTATPGLPAGTCPLALFLVNRRTGSADEGGIFQVALELACPTGFLPRPNRRDEHGQDWDDRVADLQHRDQFELAVGHGVSVEVDPPDDEGRYTTVRTAWVPRAEVHRVEPREVREVEVRMDPLAALTDGDAVRAALAALPEQYALWITDQRRIALDSDDRRDTSGALMDQADQARQRIVDGIELLATDPVALEAFRLTNLAMAEAARRRSPDRYTDGRVPEWRLFQLAFVLLSLPSVADSHHPDRATVELIFFPTGGGKTEAYLGVIAFALVLRRLRGQGRPDRGLGVAVLLRYTLRLLTLDQLARAATLMCALDKLRRADPTRLGDVRFAVGLWVGKTATANTLSVVADQIVEFKNNPSKDARSPFPLTECPWCHRPLDRDSFSLHPSKTKPEEVVVACLDARCDYAAGKNRDGLPVVFVDEQVYRELPAFLIATVDKFAMLPWRGETGALFGRVGARSGRRFFGPVDVRPKDASMLPAGLLPPELIVQDELHLISGPLGTMVGLYETAIESLCTSADGARPKILASTATVRRAKEQVKALFGRRMAQFPPPGVNAGDTWFADVDRESPGRLYLGVAAPGRAMKAILLRTYVALLAAAGRLWDPTGPPDQSADGYQTLVGYFNALRELGGMRRLVEDEVRTRCAKAAEKKPDDLTENRWVRGRTIQQEPVELTSREHTATIAKSKARLGRSYAEKDHVDVALATNMISVGVDIDRLGLMVIAGQPKAAAEYIQASSRVGRQARWPGLVVTCFNTAKPRDRSHYERFAAWHASFYRFVEAATLTPFSGPALDRGLAGTLVAMTRLGDPALTPPIGAMDWSAHRAIAEAAVKQLADRAAGQPGATDEHDAIADALAARGRNLIDAWERLVDVARTEGAGKRTYSRYDRDKAGGKPILRQRLDDDPPAAGTDDAKFTAPTSMRDVEGSAHLWVEHKALGGKS